MPLETQETFSGAPVAQTPPSVPPVVDLETPEQKYARLYSQQPGSSQAPPQAVAPPVPNDEVVNTLREMRAELAEMRAQRPQPAQVAQTPPTPLSPENETLWVEKIRQGDFKGAQEVIIKAVEDRLTPQIIERVTSQATQATNVQLEIDRHVNKVRAENPDMIQFETYLSAPINAKVEAARAAGKIHNPEDFVREYKSALDSEVATFRNLTQQYRAAGKAEATTRVQDVRVTAFTPAPQQVGDHTSVPTQPSASGESNQDYFARRAAQGARLRNL